ncbi:MAG TPA: hypothetical protein VMR66_09920 [Gemmatimonadota bacterium]|nr:hypothetical protein [Gemmatimonadota bacterium]
MHTPARRLGSLVLSLALVALGSACQGGEEADEAAPADTVETATSGAEAVSGGVAPSSSTSEAMITNTMPHAMIVTIEYPGGGATELGVVPASGEQTFTLAASAGETVTLVARDEADTHSRDATLTLSEGEIETWTIE